MPGRPHPVAEILFAFLKLGLTSFGGPVAHLGYFRDEFVMRRRWLDEHAYANLVGVCQFLPGPTSSQVGLSLGLMRAGYAGALAAWVGFTLPSAVLMLLFACGASLLEGPIASGLMHGLKLVAVAIVAHAVWSMARVLCPDRQRVFIAALAAGAVLAVSSPLAQIGVILLGGAFGLWLCREVTRTSTVTDLPSLVTRRAGIASLAIFLLLLAGLPTLGVISGSNEVALMDAFYRSGALVFGGGHVVLPLLREAVVGPGWVSGDDFLAGYGAAQALPGPLFSFAAYLGAVAAPVSQALAGAALALVGIFLPGVLILFGAYPFWEQFRKSPAARATMSGVNAAVVGLLGAALYDPVWTGSVRTWGDVGLVATGFALLTFWRAPPLLVVVLTALGGLGLAVL